MPGEFDSPKLDCSGNKKTKKKIRLPKFVRLADESEQEELLAGLEGNQQETAADNVGVSENIERQVADSALEVTDGELADYTDEIEVAKDVEIVESKAADGVRLEMTDDKAETAEPKTADDKAETAEPKTADDKAETVEPKTADDKAKTAELKTTDDKVETVEDKSANNNSEAVEIEDKKDKVEETEVAEQKIEEKTADADENKQADAREKIKTAEKEDDFDYEVRDDDDFDPDPDIIIEDLDDDDEIEPRIVRLRHNQHNRRNNSARKPSQVNIEKHHDKYTQPRKKYEQKKIDGNIRRKNKPDGLIIFVKILLAILLVAFAAYIASVIYFMSHFSWAISAEGEEQLYNMTAEDVKTVLQNQVQDYFIAVEARDLDTIYLSGHDINMTCSFDGDIKDAIKIQNPWVWFTYRSNPLRIDLPVQIHIDGDMLAQFMEDAVYSKSGRKPINAKFIDEPNQKAFLLQPEDNGTVIDAEKATAVVSEAIKSLNDMVNLDDAGVYTNAEVTAADLEKNGFYKNLIDLCKTQVNVDWHGIPVVIDKEFIYPLIQNDGQKAWIDYEPVYDYVKKLSRQYDKFGQPHKFIDTEGHEINVIMGAYGWLVDRDATAKGIYDLICKGGVNSFEPVYRYEAYARGEDDIGDSYAEINITRQHMYLYVDGKVVVESDFVSGNPMKGNGTHVGIYGITYKERDATLNGQGYSSPVSYWMPFNGNEGMHDASWRSNFGGRIYKGGGSHGCINLPVDIAGKIYEYVEKGFPVIVFTDPDDPAYQEGDDRVQAPPEEKNGEEKNDKPADANKPLFDANSGLYYILDPATNTPIFLDPETMQPTDVATAVSKLKALQEERAPE